MGNWHATFTQLREAGITLAAWLKFHQERRASLTPEERRHEE
jgi:hypothetical protein